MPRNESSANTAARLLDEARSLSDPEEANVARQEALTHAILAVANEVSELRETVGLALEDRDGAGVGTHIRYISDWLEKIAKQPR